jgi:hypothetical protein
MTLHNLIGKSKYVETAGKVTIAAAISGLLVFAFAFLFNVGKSELTRVEAQGSASTTLTVLNTPPIWVEFAIEEFESSTSTPTNSGSTISWVAVADNNGGAPYFLIVCSGSATPTPNAAIDLNSLGTAPPTCSSGIQWGVSASTSALARARVSTTTTENFGTGGFEELNNWYGWVCDDDPVNPRCNNVSSQGLNATNSSPFHVNRRPVFTNSYSDSPKDPGQTITFYSTSTDPDTTGGEDDISLYVCSTNAFSTSTLSCDPGESIASTTGSFTANATAIFTLPNIIQDDVYDAYVFLIDEHRHLAAAGGEQASNETFTVNNVAPTVASGDIALNGGLDMSLSVPSSQTTGFTLTFELSDANSCDNVGAGYELTGYNASVLRNGVGTTTCNGSSGAYNPNNCYPSGVATTTWNLSCTASTTSCGGATDPTLLYSCSFPLWFVADPTSTSTYYETDNWVAAVAGVDDNNATGTVTVGSNPIELIAFPAIDLLTAEIPYGSLEPGDDTGTLSATTTVLSAGNTGLNQNLDGESMCPSATFIANGFECPFVATSTVPDNQQEFATSSVAYGSGTNLSSTTPQLLDIRIKKSTSTSQLSSGITYWGIAVPIEVTTAGAYTGLNTFYAVANSATSTWY